MKSRGEKNNNPLNIRHSASQWQGARKELTDKSFVQFESMAYGYRAAWKILQSYYQRFSEQGKELTVRNIITRWAPPKENNTESYIRIVLILSGIREKETLLPPNDVESYDRLSRLLSAMTTMECGIRQKQIDTEAIYKGYKLAFPENAKALDEWKLAEDEYRDW